MPPLQVSDMALESVTPLSTPEPPDSWEERADGSPKEAQSSDDKKEEEEEEDKDNISTKDEKEKENVNTKESGKKEGRNDDRGKVEEVEEKSFGEKGKRAGSQEVQKSKKIKLTRDDSIASSDMDGTRTIKFLFSFGASCLEK